MDRLEEVGKKAKRSDIWKGNDYFYFLVYTAYNARYINAILLPKTIRDEGRTCPDCLAEFTNKTSVEEQALKYHKRWIRAIRSFYKKANDYPNHPVVDQWKKFEDAAYPAYSSAAGNSKAAGCKCLVRFVLAQVFGNQFLDVKLKSSELKYYESLLDYLKTKVKADMPGEQWLMHGDESKIKSVITSHTDKTTEERNTVLLHIYLADPQETNLFNQSDDSYCEPPAAIEDLYRKILKPHMVTYHPDSYSFKHHYDPNYSTMFLHGIDWSLRLEAGNINANESLAEFEKIRELLSTISFVDNTESMTTEEQRVADLLGAKIAEALPNKDKHELPSIKDLMSIGDLLDEISAKKLRVPVFTIEDLVKVCKECHFALARNLITINMLNLTTQRKRLLPPGSLNNSRFTV